MITWTLIRDSVGPLMQITGQITEDAVFPTLDDVEPMWPIRIELSGIQLISSAGVRRWIDFVTLLSLSGQGYELLACSPAIVRQFNMVSNSRGTGTVRSIMLPYYCCECGFEANRLMDLPLDGSIPDINAEISCGACDDVAEFDDIETSYLAFAAQTHTEMRVAR